jgi:hypothetical protein
MTRQTLFILISTFLFFGHHSNGQTVKDSTTSCKNIREGTFKLVDNSVYTIVRSAKTQMENDARTGKVSIMDIKWLADCSYILFNRRVVKGTDDMPPGMIDTLYNEIKNINGSSHIVSSTVKKYGTFEATLVKVEDSLLYRDIKDLPAFKEYNGTTWGGTLIDDNYSVAYRQKTNNKKDFVIAFEETYSINHSAKFRLLDTVYTKIEDNQSIATKNCRFNDKYDPEIIAIYSSKNDNKESKIIKAWRCNRKTLKMEIVDSKKIKYKVADESLFLWNK